jgi:hypothetical protein
VALCAAQQLDIIPLRILLKRTTFFYETSYWFFKISKLIAPENLVEIEFNMVLPEK